MDTSAFHCRFLSSHQHTYPSLSEHGHLHFNNPLWHILYCGRKHPVHWSEKSKVISLRGNLYAPLTCVCAGLIGSFCNTTSTLSLVFYGLHTCFLGIQKVGLLIKRLRKNCSLTSSHCKVSFLTYALIILHSGLNDMTTLKRITC